MTRAPLELIGYVTLPEHIGKGGFDHAAVHAASGNVYVAHTANDTVDVFDPASEKFLFSISGLSGAAGVLISEEAQLIISSNRAENTIGIFAPGAEPKVTKIAVGVHPNGLAFDPERRSILVANVGDPAIPGSYTLTVISLDQRRVRAEIPVAGRTRWALYDPDAQAFYVNVADPAEIVVVDARNPVGIARVIPIPSVGPHGLDIDLATHRLFCACDSGVLVTLDVPSGKVICEKPLSGTPDVVFFNPVHQQIYVAIGDPGVIDVFDTKTMETLGRVATEKGTHTTALAPAGDRLYAFMPTTHRAAMYKIS